VNEPCGTRTHIGQRLHGHQVDPSRGRQVAVLGRRPSRLSEVIIPAVQCPTWGRWSDRRTASDHQYSSDRPQLIWLADVVIPSALDRT